MSGPLRAADLRFINRIASLRFAGTAPGGVDDAALSAAADDVGDGTPFLRAAVLAATLLHRRVFATAPLQTALLSLHCALALEGLSLLAPQGVAAGMIQELARGGNTATMARWLEDRAVPSAGG
jgi:prophage maintenance system killer protein